MYSRTTTPRTAHLTPQPITKQQVLDAAVHWRKEANEQDAIADSETAQGLPRGDVSSFRARATLWRQVANDLEATAKVVVDTMKVAEVKP
jgi:hypothetical protein